MPTGRGLVGPSLLRVGSYGKEYDGRKIASLEQRSSQKFQLVDKALSSLVTAWTFYDPVFKVINGTSATLGDGYLSGLYRMVGDSVEIQQTLEWSATSSFGSPSPFVVISMPSGLIPDLRKMLVYRAASVYVVQVTLAGMIGGAISEGVTYYAVGADVGGVQVFLALPSDFASLFQAGDFVLMKTSIPVIETQISDDGGLAIAGGV